VRLRRIDWLVWLGEELLPNRFLGVGIEVMIERCYFNNKIKCCDVCAELFFALISKLVFFGFEVGS